MVGACSIMELAATAARPGWAYLVGAGPGDPGLLTVRGAQLLATADAVLHDELLDPAVLAQATGELHAVGKRGSDPEEKDAKQQEIIDQLLALTRAGHSVVRLKGGDPLLFGRGSEEALALRQAAIPFEIVPGVCSPLGATAYAGIPLTHRELASSVTFLTAVKSGGALFEMGQLRGLEGTVCVLMGTRHLRQICRGLIIDAAFAATTPAAVVQWISYPTQTTITGTLADIADRAAEAAIGSPSLLVVGGVAELREPLSWFDNRPLFGKRVLLTRPAHQLAPTIELLRRRGAEAVAFPTIAIEPPPDPALVQRAVQQLGSYDLVALTSANGVRELMREIDRQGLDARAFGAAKLAAIGPATAAELSQHGLRCDIVATTFVAEKLVEAIVATFGERQATKVLLPRALVAREVLPTSLRAAGMQVDVVPVYQTVGAAPERGQELRELLGSVDIVLLTSSSTAEQLCAVLGDSAAEALAGCMIASIGPITTATAERLGLDVQLTAEISTTGGLVDALEAKLG